MKRHDSRFWVMTFVLVVAAVASIPFLPFTRVQAALLTVTLSPTSAQPGQTVYVSATGASVAVGTSCAITSDFPGLIASFSASVVSSGTVAGSFSIAPYAPEHVGGYIVTVSCPSAATPTDSGTASFDVLPKIVLSATVGVSGQVVTVSGSGFRTDISSCMISGAVTTLQSCTLGTTTTTATTFTTISTPSGTITGQFTVASIANGIYTVTVTPDVGSAATTDFNLVSSPTIVVSPSAVPPGFGTLPADGSARVTVTGGGFATRSSATTCTLSSATGLLFAASPATTCTISTSGTVSAAFAVNTAANPALSPFTIRVSDGSPPTPSSIFAETTFTVAALPVLTLSATSGTAGTPIAIAVGTGFAGGSTYDTGACTISSNPTGLIASQTCFIDNTGTVSAGSGFTVSSLASGGYTITLTAIHGDFGTAVFTVTTGTLTINPVSGSPAVGSLAGTSVTITGSGFAPQDTSCTVTQTAPVPSSTQPNIISSLSCTISGGNVNAQFVIAPASTFGTYTLEVKGTPVFDTATVTFDVVPRIVLNPTYGPIGTGPVSVVGSGFTGGAGPAACVTFTSSPATLFAATPPAQCTLNNDGTVVGSFYVDATLPPTQGGYAVSVVGVAADTASATFVVAARLLTVTPSSGFPAYSGVLGTFVSVNGTGFSITDTTCALSSSPAGLTLTGATCTITNGNVVGTFQVGSGSTAGIYNIIATGAPAGDTGIGVFTVGVVTASTSTVTSSSLSFTTTSITTSSSTTQVSTSFSTTTLQTTGVKTESYTSFTRTTTSALTTTTTTYTTTFVSTIYLLTTTVFTTISTVITHTLGQIISVHESRADGLGVLALLLVLGPMIIRRRWKS